MGFTNQEKRNIKALREQKLPHEMAYMAKATLSQGVVKGASEDYYAGWIAAINQLSNFAVQIPNLDVILTAGAVLARIAADQIPESSLVEEEGEEDVEKWLNELEGMLERAV